jgi:hypothetical protein
MFKNVSFKTSKILYTSVLKYERCECNLPEHRPATELTQLAIEGVKMVKAAWLKASIYVRLADLGLFRLHASYHACMPAVTSVCTLTHFYLPCSRSGLRGELKK